MSFKQTAFKKVWEVSKPSVSMLLMESFSHINIVVYMVTTSKGNIFHVVGPLWGESTDHRIHKKTVTRSFDVVFDLRLGKWLSKQSRRRRFESPSHSLWRHRNVNSALEGSGGSFRLLHLCMRSANERRRYIVTFVTSSLIGWAHTQNDRRSFVITGYTYIDVCIKSIYLKKYI